MIATLLWVALAQAAAAAADPLALAREGQAQCYAPDVARRTCRSLGGYALRPDGRYDNRAVVLVSLDPPITLETTAPVEVNLGAVCGVLSPRDLEGGIVLLEGQPATPEQADVVRQAVSRSLEPLYGHEICSTYVPQGAGLVAQVSVAGTRRPDMDLPVIWVRPADGYRVAP